jgi:hypothetical protein
MGDLEGSLRILLEVQEQFAELNMPEHLHNCNEAIAKIRMGQGRPTDARVLVRAKMRWSRSARHPVAKAYSYWCLGKLEKLNSNHRIAVKYLEMALRRFERLGMLFEVEKLRSELSALQNAGRK